VHEPTGLLLHQLRRPRLGGPHRCRSATRAPWPGIS